MYASAHAPPPPPPSLLPRSATPASSASLIPERHLASSLPPTRPLSQHGPLHKPDRSSARTPPGNLPRRAALNAQMQRGPYLREATDITDQELRQILDSENISGQPMQYCLVPHYDGQAPHSQGAVWQAPGGPRSQAPPAPAPATGAQRPAPGAPSAAASGDQPRRRTRTTLTPYQLRVLFRVWERTQYPSSDLRFRLASSLMMTPRNVQIWFQNQRQKSKERAEMRRRTHSPSTSVASMLSVAAVQRQVGRPLSHQPVASAAARVAEIRAHVQASLPAGVAGAPPPDSPFCYTHGPPPPPAPLPPHVHTAAPGVPPHHALHYRPTTSPLTMSPTLYPHAYSQQSHLPPQARPVYYSSSQPILQYPPASPSHAHYQQQQQQQQQQRYHHHHHQRHASHPHPALAPTDTLRSAPPRVQLQPPPLALPAESHDPRHPASPPASLQTSPVPESPTSRRACLAEILNPMQPADDAPAGQAGPLPSLGAVLAAAQPAASEPCAPGSSASLDSSAGPAATAATSDKWRPW